MIIEVGEYKVKVYEDIRQLPDTKKQAMERYLLLSNEVGSSAADYQNKQQQILSLVERGLNTENVDDAKDILLQVQTLSENSFMNVSAIESPVSFKALAFAALVESVNGEAVNDLSEDALVDLVFRLGVSYQQASDVVELVKKNSNDNLQRTFLTDTE